MDKIYANMFANLWEKYVKVNRWRIDFDGHHCITILFVLDIKILVLWQYDCGNSHGKIPLLSHLMILSYKLSYVVSGIFGCNENNYRHELLLSIRGSFMTYVGACPKCFRITPSSLYLVCVSLTLVAIVW